MTRIAVHALRLYLAKCCVDNFYSVICAP